MSIAWQSDRIMHHTGSMLTHTSNHKGTQEHGCAFLDTGKHICMYSMAQKGSAIQKHIQAHTHAGRDLECPNMTG